MSKPTLQPTTTTGYIKAYALSAPSDWQAQAIEWSATRGARSGRVAWHFMQDLMGRMGNPLPLGEGGA